MSKKMIGTGLLIAAAFMLIMVGCSKTTTVVMDSGTAVTTTVQFTKDIVPILAKNCAVTGCHNGSVKPNLTSALAYNSLVSGGYTNTGNPPQSEVYLWLTGKKSATMPLGAPNNPSNINQLMLAWIKQGAKNN